MDFDIVEGNDLSCTDFAGFAQLDQAIDVYRGTGDQRFTGAAAVTQSDQLEQLIEFDMVAIELEFNALHESDRLLG